MSRFDRFIADLTERAEKRGVDAFSIRLVDDRERHNVGMDAANVKKFPTMASWLEDVERRERRDREKNMDAEKVKKAAEKILPKGALKKLADAGLLVVSAQDWEHLGGSKALPKESRFQLEDMLRDMQDERIEAGHDVERLEKKVRRLRRIVRLMARAL